MRISDWSSDVCASDLIGGDVAAYAVDGLEADVGDRIAGRLVRGGLAIDPQGEIGVRSIDLVGESGFERRRRKIRGDAIEFGARRIVAERRDMRELLLHLTGEFLDAEIVDEDLHPLLVAVVAPRVPVPHAQVRLAIADTVGRASRRERGCP